MIRPTSATTPSTALTYEERLRSDTGFAMEEIGLFFQGDSQVHQTLKAITEKLDSLGIPYAVAGGLALAGHGYYRTTDDVDLLTTHEGLKRVHAECSGLGYVPVFKGSKNLRDTKTRVKIEFLINGQYPGDGKPKPVVFPEPIEASEIRDGIRFLKLKDLIELKLASGMTAEHRGRDLIDVQEVIRVLNLKESFANQLNEYVRATYLDCYRKIRRRYVRLWRNKFLTTEASSLQEMSEILRAASDELNAMLQDGVRLDPGGGVGDDYAVLVTDDPDIAAKYNMHDEEEWWNLEGDESSDTDRS